VQYWTWNPEKNELLRLRGRPEFEEVLTALREGGLRAYGSNPHHPGQMILVVMIDGYAHAVPYRIEGEVAFMLTVYPSRKLQKRFGGDPP
jgi:hypothetical protein